MKSGVQLNRLAHAGRGVDASVLQHHANTVDQQFVVIFWVQPQNADRSRRGFAQSFATLDHAGLTRAIWPQDGCNATGVRLKTQVVHREKIAITNRQPLNTYSRTRCVHPVKDRQFTGLGPHHATSLLSTVIDVRALRNDPAAVRTALARRNKPEVLEALETAITLDEKMRLLTNERDDARQEINAISKNVGQLRRDGKTNEAETAMAKSRELGEREKELAAAHAAVEAEMHEILLRIPNLPHADAPDGADDSENPLIKGPIGVANSYPDHKRVPHWETGKELGILDLERATKIAGTMFTMQRGLGATMARALCQLALDVNADAFE